MTARAAEKDWKTLTPDEKLDRRFTAWLAAGGINFASAQAERDYEARAKRFADAIRLKKPDRVSLNPSFGGGYIMATGAGVGRGARVENVRAMIKFVNEFGVYS